MNEYLDYYMLNYFDFERVTTSAQLVHVFHGKRTPSMFYLIEKNNWHHGFECFFKISNEDVEAIIKRLTNLQFLRKEEKGYLLTQLGAKSRLEYFKLHYYPNKIQSFTHSRVRNPFWNRLQLYTQVFSEFSYGQTKYIPVIKHPHHQENVRQLFVQFDKERLKLLTIWLNEQYQLLDLLEDRQADMLFNQFTGHQHIGKTKNQMAEFYGMSQLEFSFFLFDTIEQLIQLIKQHREKFPLTYRILHIVELECNLGLSGSTYLTYEHIKNGYSISQIAQIRNIKENTVKEHILEIAFVFEQFPYNSFVPSDLYEQLNKIMSENDDFNFNDMTNVIEDVEFFQYRLVELERMRKNENSN